MEFTLDDFGAIARAERKKRNLTVKTVASDVGYTEQAIYRLERGELRASIDFASNLLNYYGYEMKLVAVKKGEIND